MSESGVRYLQWLDALPDMCCVHRNPPEHCRTCAAARGDEPPAELPSGYDVALARLARLRAGERPQAEGRGAEAAQIARAGAFRDEVNLLRMRMPIAEPQTSDVFLRPESGYAVGLKRLREKGGR